MGTFICRNYKKMAVKEIDPGRRNRLGYSIIISKWNERRPRFTETNFIGYNLDM